MFRLGVMAPTADFPKPFGDDSRTSNPIKRAWKEDRIDIPSVLLGCGQENTSTARHVFEQAIRSRRRSSERARSRGRRNSLRNVKNSTEVLRQRSLKRGNRELASDNSAIAREGRHFTVANVGNNGKIYLRYVRPCSAPHPFSSQRMTPSSPFDDADPLPSLHRIISLRLQHILLENPPRRKGRNPTWKVRMKRSDGQTRKRQGRQRDIHVPSRSNLGLDVLIRSLGDLPSYPGVIQCPPLEQTTDLNGARTKSSSIMASPAPSSPGSLACLLLKCPFLIIGLAHLDLVLAEQLFSIALSTQGLPLLKMSCLP